MQYAKLLAITYGASNSAEPIERYYASQFGSYYDKSGSQPGSAAINGILRGAQLPSRKLLRHYRDAEHPRCPDKLRTDLQALLDTCFADGVRRSALRRGLEDYVSTLPPAEAADLWEIMVVDDLAQTWACLTWYALCGDCHE